MGAKHSHAASMLEFDESLLHDLSPDDSASIRKYLRHHRQKQPHQQKKNEQLEQQQQQQSLTLSGRGLTPSQQKIVMDYLKRNNLNVDNTDSNNNDDDSEEDPQQQRRRQRQQRTLRAAQHTPSPPAKPRTKYVSNKSSPSTHKRSTSANKRPASIHQRSTSNNNRNSSYDQPIDLEELQDIIQTEAKMRDGIMNVIRQKQQAMEQNIPPPCKWVQSSPPSQRKSKAMDFVSELTLDSTIEQSQSVSAKS